MVAADWGADDDEPYAAGRWASEDSVDGDDPKALPEIKVAMAEGFEPEPESLLWCFLPAIWPHDARTWVNDRRVRYMQRVYNDDREPRRIPWSAATYFEIEQDINECLRGVGIGPRPGGRIWLLKPAPGFKSLEPMLADLARSADAAGLMITATPEFVKYVDAQVRGYFPRQ